MSSTSPDPETLPVQRSLFRRVTRYAFVLCTVSVLLLSVWVFSVPFPLEVLRPESSTSTLVTDREGRILREVLNDQEGRLNWRMLHNEDDVYDLRNIVQATIHAEDKRFWDHIGFDPIAILRSVVYNIQRRRVVTGASTLTQQTAKLLLYANQRRTLGLKLEELAYAVRLERAVSKRKILEQYLNRAPYGNQLFGIEAASWMYFSIPPEDLSIAQAALLAGLPQSPTTLNPYRFPKRAQKRQRLILRAMHERGAITREAYTRAIDEKIVFHPKKGTFRAPHFVEFALKSYQKLRANPPSDLAALDLPVEKRPTMWDKHPARLKTTLDLVLQESVEGIVRNRVEGLKDRSVTQAAALVLDTQTGAIFAYVGSRDYWDKEHAGANDGVLALRQPGSTLKPFIYGLYMEQGGTAADVFLDQKTQFKVKDGVYVPMNYDRRFYGPVMLRDALGSSLNIPAVYATTEVGVESVLRRLRALGLESLTESAEHYGPGIALGDGEVRLLDLAGAYTALGRLGSVRAPHAIKAVNTEGVRYDYPDEVMDRDISYVLLDLLSDDNARAKGFGVAGPLMLPYKVAAKTGTSTNFRDNWAVGVTPEYTVAVWVGNFDGSPTRHVSGVLGAAPIMREIFQALHPTASGPEDVPWYPQPKTVETHSVCALSGQPVGPHCAHTREEVFARGRDSASGGLGESGERAEGPERCAIHQLERIDVRNDLRAGAACPPQFVEMRPVLRVPPDWLGWAREQRWSLPVEEFSPLCPDVEEDLDTRTEDVLRRDVMENQVHITNPKDGDSYIFSENAPEGQQSVRLRARIGAERNVEQVVWFVDGREIARVGPPFDTYWDLSRGRHRVSVADAATGEVEHEVTVNVE